jgi:hypothetical protein
MFNVIWAENNDFYYWCCVAVAQLLFNDRIIILWVGVTEYDRALL